MKFQIQHIPFIKIDKKTLDELSEWPKDRNPYIFIHQYAIHFVSIQDLNWEKYKYDAKIEKYTDYYTPRVMCLHLSLCDARIEKMDKSKTPSRFCYGVYHESGNLLLLDDLIEWALHRINVIDVRSAWDIIKESKK
jgi:hypothetical protein